MYTGESPSEGGTLPGSCELPESFGLVASPPNSALQRAAFGIKCSAAGGRAQRAHRRWRARVLSSHLAVAELGS